MKFIYTLFALLIFSTSFSVAQTILWDITYGSTATDRGISIVSTPDGGYLLGGKSNSDAGFEKSQNIKSYDDFWIIKVDAQGNKLWDKSFSGLGSHSVNQSGLSVILPLTGGGYLVGGYSEEDMGYEKSENSRGNGLDYWIIRLDASGNQLWDKTIGGPAIDGLNDMVETDDGGFLLGGYSFGQDLGTGFEKTAVPRSYSEDYWIVKIDDNGNKLWDKIYGGEKSETCKQIVKTHDGNYLLVGSSNSPAGHEKTENPKGGYDFNNYDYWLVKIDPDGNKLWDKTIGGDALENVNSAVLTSDGGFLLAGESQSQAGYDKSQNNRGSYDYWLVKTDADGNVKWDKTYGGTGNESIADMLVTPDNQLILLGSSDSPVGNEKTEPSRGDKDYWILKTDMYGTVTWDKTIGGNERDHVYNGILNDQDELLILGSSASSIGYDKTESNRDGGQARYITTDYWLVKLDTKKKTMVPEVDINDAITCFPCWPWEIWIDFEYRFWNERYGLRRAVYRQAFEGRHQDKVYWEDEKTLTIQLNEEGLNPGNYQFQIRALLKDGSTTEWTDPEGFEVGGTVTKVFPNPVKEVLNIHYRSGEKEMVYLQINNRFGKVILREQRTAYSGLNEWKVEMPQVNIKENPLTLQVISPSRGEQSWKLIRE
jgi:hypothetical protein